MLHKNLNSVGTAERAALSPVAYGKNGLPFVQRFIQGARAFRLFSFLIFLALFSWVQVASAASPTTSSNRFLFVVDASATMRPFETPTRETIFDLVYSGVRGHMTNGDTYGIWVVNDQNDTSFPMDVWRSKFIVESAAKAVKHVKDRGTQGKSHMNLVVEDVTRVVQNVGDLTVILISNGESPLVGTPFDAEINARFRELAPVMKKAKATMNTTLVAQDGVFVAWAVNAPEFLIDIPYVAPKPKTKAEPVASTAVTPTAPAVVAAEVKPASVVPQKPRSASGPIVITKETVAQERRSYQAMTAAASTDEVASVVATNVVPPPAETVAESTVVTASNAAVANPSKTSLVANLSPASTLPKTNATTLTSAVAKVTKPEATNVAATVAAKVEPPSKPLVAATTVETPVGSTFHPMLWAAFGAGLTLAGVFAVYFVIRSRRIEPSLISEALAQERFSRQSTSVRS